MIRYGYSVVNESAFWCLEGLSLIASAFSADDTFGSGLLMPTLFVADVKRGGCCVKAL